MRARALEAFATAYWTPVSRYIRFKWRLDAEHAADLTQEFFARTLENDALARFDPERARFRTYVRLLVDGFVSNARKADLRLKRGGAFAAVPLEETLADGQVRSHEPPVIDDHDEAFYREWVRALFEGRGGRPARRGPGPGPRRAVRGLPPLRPRRLRGEAQPSYADVAAALGLTVTTVTNHLAAMRRMLRARVLDRLREATGSDEEFEAEAKRLLGTRR